jgi:hypothetical protein
MSDCVRVVLRLLSRSLSFTLSQDHLSVASRSPSLAIILRICSLPNMGARLRKVRKTSLNRISGLVRREETVFGVGEGVEATVWRISPT